MMNNQKASSSQRPSFFKVLIHYTTQLRLPPVFVCKFGKFLPEIAKLRAISGETWVVKLKEEISDEDGETYMWIVGRGWAKFVKDLKLKFGEFLVFFLNVSESTFDVLVYETHSFKRQFSAMDVVSDADSEMEIDCDVVPDDCRRRRLKRRNCSPESELSERPHFELRLRKNQNSRRCIPKTFIEAANLTGKRAVVMEYPPTKRYWAVNLDPTARSGKSVDLCGPGWKEFRQANGLVEGKTYSFEFNPTKNVIEVKEHS